jgi:hypothetical protein
MGAEEIVYMAVTRGELEIDTHGQIWRTAARRGGRHGIRTIPCERRRAEHQTTSGYLQVRVMTDGRRVNALAHRVVWLHFRGPIPSGLTINHRNGNKADNRPENLEVATYSEQVLHSRRVLGGGDQRGERNPAAKLTRDQVEEIRRRRAMKEPLKAIAASFGVSDRTVSKIARGQRWHG